MSATWTSRAERFGLLFVALLAFAVYAQTLRFDFALDDKSVVVGNEALEDWRAWPQIFAEDYLARTPVTADGSMYRPLTTLSFALGNALHGLSPAWFHAGNALLHAFVSVLVVLLAARFASKSIAIASGVLFAVHPIHVEAVANVAGRPELLAALGLFGATLAWSHARRADGRARRAWSATCIAAAILALFSKENGVMVVPLIAVCEMIERPRSPWTKSAGVLAASLVLLTVAFLVVHARVTTPPSAPAGLAVFASETRVATALTVLVRQLGQLVAPLHSSAIWTMAEIHVEPHIVAIVPIACALGLAALLLLAWRVRAVRPDVAFGTAWFACAILPTSNLVIPIGTVAAERLLYAPSFGFVLVLAALVELATRRIGGRRTFAVVIVIVSALYAARTALRNRDWRDDETLGAATLISAPRSALGPSLLADWHNAHGDLNEAARYIRIALEREPGFERWFLLGDVERRAGRPDEALRAWRRALELQPDAESVLLSLSTLCLETKQPAEALPLLERLVKLRPDLVAARANQCAALAQVGRVAEAADLAVRAVHDFPGDLQLLHLAADILRAAGRTPEADKLLHTAPGHQ